MNKTLVITILGPDRVGMVEQIAAAINNLGGNWTDSRMAHLGGQFAGILQLEIVASKLEPLRTELQALETDGLQILIQENANSSGAHVNRQTLIVELLGQDRAGIISDITQQLATLEVNIEELTSEVREASMSGEQLFSATLNLSIPEHLSTEAVKDALEELADQFMVDLNFDSRT